MYLRIYIEIVRIRLNLLQLSFELSFRYSRFKKQPNYIRQEFLFKNIVLILLLCQNDFRNENENEKDLIMRQIMQLNKSELRKFFFVCQGDLIGIQKHTDVRLCLIFISHLKATFVYICSEDRKR